MNWQKWILTLAALAIVAGCTPVDTEDHQRVSVQATQTAIDLKATATAIDLEDRAFTLERKRKRAESVDVFLAALPWVILVMACGAATVAGVVIGLPFARVALARYQIVKRSPMEGEPLWVSGDGQRFALPLRAAGLLADLTPGQERSPLLAHSEGAQDNATGRQQAANAILARLAPEIAKGLTGGGDVTYVTQTQGGRGASPSPSTPKIRVVEPDQGDGWIEDTESQMLLEAGND